MMGKKRILVLGAGLAGLSAAWHLQRRGMDCQVFEKEPEAGGLCTSRRVNKFIFDRSGHLLHFRHKYALDLVRNLLSGNLLKHDRSAWIYSHGRYSRYPFQANLYGLPKSVVEDCLIGFIKAHNERGKYGRQRQSFGDWIVQTFGRGMSRHFMIPYNTKFWTLPPDELTCEWLDGFIPVPSLKEVVEGTIEESRRQFGYNAQFWYPKKGGIREVALSFMSQVRNIHTACGVSEIDLLRKEIKTESGHRERFDYLVSTIPLPSLPRIIKNLPSGLDACFKRLRWNSIFNLNLGIKKKDYSGRHWIYFPGREISFFRLGFFNNFSPDLAPRDASSLYAEVSYSESRPQDKGRIASIIKNDLKHMGLLDGYGSILVEDLNDIRYGYPIYDADYAPARAKITEFLVQNNILPCGRYGSWRYMSMEDAILEGRAIGDKLCGPGSS